MDGTSLQSIAVGDREATRAGRGYDFDIMDTADGIRQAPLRVSVQHNDIDFNDELPTPFGIKPRTDDKVTD